MKTKILATLFFFFIVSNPIMTLSANEPKNSTLDSTMQGQKPLYEILEPGDILIYLSDRPDTEGHCRIFKEYNDLTRRYIFIEAAPVVVKHSMTELRLKALAWFWYERLVVVRIVNATEEQKQNAIEFCERQIGKKFDGNYLYINKSYNPEDGEKNSNEWYCSELVWAAYYNCNYSFPRNIGGLLGKFEYGKGIDIDYNGWMPDSEDDSGNKYIFVGPEDIVKDPDVKEILEIWNGKPFISYFIRR